MTNLACKDLVAFEMGSEAIDPVAWRAVGFRVAKAIQRVAEEKWEEQSESEVDLCLEAASTVEPSELSESDSDVSERANFVVNAAAWSQVGSRIGGVIRQVIETDSDELSVDLADWNNVGCRIAKAVFLDGKDSLEVLESVRMLEPIKFIAPVVPINSSDSASPTREPSEMSYSDIEDP